MNELSPEWRALLEKLWQPDEKTFEEFLPEIVATIKSTPSSAMAECGLFTAVLCPKLNRAGDDMLPRLRTPSAVQPLYQGLKVLADAAGLPVGRERKEAFKKIRDRGRYQSLTAEEIVDIFERIPKEKLDSASASARHARRARNKIGMSRPPGRPRNKPDTPAL